MLLSALRPARCCFRVEFLENERPPFLLMTSVHDVLLYVNKDRAGGHSLWRKRIYNIVRWQWRRFRGPLRHYGMALHLQAKGCGCRKSMNMNRRRMIELEENSYCRSHFLHKIIWLATDADDNNGTRFFFIRSRNLNLSLDVLKVLAVFRLKRS